VMTTSNRAPNGSRRRAKRHWAVRVLRAFTIGVTVFTLAVAGLVTAWLHGVRLPIASGRTLIKVQKLATANYEGEPSGTQFILLIGSDLRPGVGGSRGDALHVLAVNPRLHKGTLLNIPRDTCAPIPGYGTTKINAANAYGGPVLQAQVIDQMLGIHLSYSVLVDFAGFGALVNGVGGVTIQVTAPMNDHNSGAYFTPGAYHVDGGGALAFSRDRDDFPRGDITRTANQAALILDAMAQLRQRAGTPAGAFRLLALLGQNATITGASLTDLYRLGRLAGSVNPANIRNVTIPVGGGGCLPLLSNAPAVFADFADDGVLETH
jgi:polyisoprenyl-teichoic acid--peptidoglycan teichoic acid transferase